MLLFTFIFTAFAGGANHRVLDDPNNYLPVTIEEAFDNAKAAMELYKRRQIDGVGEFHSTAPPIWATEFMKSSDFEEHAKRTQVYYSTADRLEDVRSLAIEREPVNIEMDRFYDVETFEKKFHYKYGAYQKSTKDKLMPNIAIYTYAPLRLTIEGKEQKATAHVLNMIGTGFDTPEQPDFQYFLDENKELTPEKEVELKKRIEMMYRYAFECANANKLKKIQWSGVGDGNFAACSAEGVDMKDTVRSFIKEAKQTLKEEYKDIELVEGWNGKPFFNVPKDFFEDVKENQLESTLYLNAWDPWSLVGNGNEGDDSLDGKYGRISAMAWLAWPLTNPFLTQESWKLVKNPNVQAPAEEQDEDSVESSEELSDNDSVVFCGGRILAFCGCQKPKSQHGD